MTHAAEVQAGARFKFGENWANFLTSVDEPRIREAVASLRHMLGVDDLKGLTLLDIGSGSGLFSLAARILGAEVVSFDYDPQSVACAAELRSRHFPDDPQWQVLSGSVLDDEFLATLPAFDIVYSWGVLHHTGRMWPAIANACAKVKPGGQLFIALYNYQPVATRYWSLVKRTYNRSSVARLFWTAVHTVYPLVPSMVLRAVQKRPLSRGMDAWHDLKDWLGGYPFEVAKPEEVFEFCKARGFALSKLVTVGGRMGCNEFVFSLPTAGAGTSAASDRAPRTVR